MPSDQSTWLIAVPQDGDSEGISQELSTKLSHQSRSFSARNIAQLGIPSFKVFPFLERYTSFSSILSVDRNSRSSYRSFRGPSEAGYILHCNRCQNC